MKAIPTPTPLPKAEIESLELDKETVTMICPGMKRKIGYCPGEEDGVVVSAKVKIKGSATTNLQTHFIVSGGKIIGSGTEVFWDLTKERPGKYTISAGVGMGDIINGNIISKTITLQECECDPGCECVTGTISGPTANVKAGDILVFTAKTSETEKPKRYFWTVSLGTIVAGQETDRIFVKIPQDAKDVSMFASVSVQVAGPCVDACPSIESAPVTIVGGKAEKP